MADWHYYNENGEKIGPIRGRELKRLAQQGAITPETRVEDEHGRTALAKNVTGLPFYEANPFSTTSPKSEESSSIAMPLPPTPSVEENPFSTSVPFAQTAQVSEPPPTVNLFCTNCGNAVSEHAVACMSCGAKPVGHKKFCRQCGVALNPEQVVCVKCGAAVSTGYTDEAKRVIQSVVSEQNMEKLKQLPKSVIVGGIAVVAVVLLLFFLGKALTMDFLPKLTAAEQAEVDGFIALAGTSAMAEFLETVSRESGTPDMDRVHKYLKHFVAKGADVNAKSVRSGYAPLRFVAGFSIDEQDIKNQMKMGIIMRFLLDKGADVNTDLGGETLIHVAAQHGDVASAKVFISKGAKIDAQVFYVAVENGHVPMAKFLVSKWADVKETIKKDGSLLRQAVDRRNVEMVRFLVSNGADVNVEIPSNIKGMTLLDMLYAKHYAVDEEDWDAPSKAILKILKNAGAKSGLSDRTSGGSSSQATPRGQRGQGSEGR